MIQMIIVILRDVSMMSYLSAVLCQGGEMQTNVKSSLS